MNRYRPMSRIQMNNKLSLGKINKSNIIHRNNLSSFARRTNYNNQKFSTTNYLQYKFKPKLFSLLDINDKITNSRGTVLPIQYKRLTDEENKRLFGFSYRTDRVYDFSKIQQLLGTKYAKSAKKEMINDEKMNEKEERKYNRYNSDIGDQLRNKKNKFLKQNIIIKDKIENNEIKLEDNHTLNANNNPNKNKIKILYIKERKNVSESNKIKNKKEEQKVFEKEKILIRNRKDRWLPTGYSSYECLFKNPKIFANQSKKGYNLNKNLSSTFEQIREKAHKSDIFFLKNPSEKEISFNKHTIKSYNQQNSDVFNIKNDEQNLLKSSETYLFKNIKGERYNITRESNSKWEPRANIPTFINYSSKEYNILNPSKKGSFSTKNKIIIECENKKETNSKMKDNVNYMNPIYRQKGLAEFIDITRNGASNPGIDFMRTYYNNPKCFFKYNEACSTFNDCHLQYKNLCTKPFVKDFILK